MTKTVKLSTRKQYLTRNGLKARIAAIGTTPNGEQVAVVCVENEQAGTETIHLASDDGRRYRNGKPDALDLVVKPPMPVLEVDTLVRVRLASNGGEQLGHYAGTDEEGHPTIWRSGATSRTSTTGKRVRVRELSAATA